MLRANKDEDILLNNNTKTLVMVKEQYGFGKRSETLGAIASPNVKTFH